MIKKAASKILLTIAIPTYNRLNCLKLLLESLLKDIPKNFILGEEIEILICNNASTDDTKSYLDAMSVANNIRLVHHEINCGGDTNIAYCCGAALGKYLWIIGDDDLPMRGALPALLKFLAEKNPVLLYLPALWKKEELKFFLDLSIESPNFISTNSRRLAVEANVYVTFISSWVMNMDKYKESSDINQIGRFKDYSLGQMEWILTLLLKKHGLYFSKSNWLFARAGNSGNYALFEVFSKNFDYVISQKFEKKDKIAIFLRKFMLWCFLPGLIWDVRNKNAGNFELFDSGKTFSILNPIYSDSLFFNVLIVPVIKYKIRWANYFRYAAAALAKIWFYLCKKNIL